MKAHPPSTRTSDPPALEGPALKLAVAQNLARLHADVLRDPLPPDLQWLIGRLERQMAPERPVAPPPA